MVINCCFYFGTILPWKPKHLKNSMRYWSPWAPILPNSFSLPVCIMPERWAFTGRPNWPGYPLMSLVHGWKNILARVLFYLMKLFQQISILFEDSCQVDESNRCRLKYQPADISFKNSITPSFGEMFSSFIQTLRHSPLHNADTDQIDDRWGLFFILRHF